MGDVPQTFQSQPGHSRWRMSERPRDDAASIASNGGDDKTGFLLDS